jgi:hypothetical protein
VSLCSGGRKAIEIVGGRPSSCRRLAQNAVVMIRSIVSESGFGALLFLNAGVARVAIRAVRRSATVLAAG